MPVVVPNSQSFEINNSYYKNYKKKNRKRHSSVDSKMIESYYDKKYNINEIKEI